MSSFVVIEKYIKVCSYLLKVCLSKHNKDLEIKSPHLFSYMKCYLGKFLGKVPNVSHLPPNGSDLLTCLQPAVLWSTLSPC